MIGAFRSSMLENCSLGSPLSYNSPVVAVFDCVHLSLRNFFSTLLVDAVRVKCYVNSFFDPASVPVTIAINKLNLVPKRLVSGVVGVL